jgi:hypothetical protein
MDESERMPLTPVKGEIRIAVQLDCGCQTALDFPVKFFNDALNNGIPQDQAIDSVIGYYGAALYRQLVSNHNTGEHCPVSYDAGLVGKWD